MYCYPDGTCHPTPFAWDHDVGAISLAVDGAPLGELAFEAGMYVPSGELTRLQPLWRAGQHVAATNAAFSVEGVAPEVPDVTTFAHTVAAQLEPAGRDLALSWNAGEPGEVVEISVGTSFAYVLCLASDDGSFAVPWSVFQGIQATGGGELFVFLDRTRRAVVDSPLGPVALLMRATDNQQFAFSTGAAQRAGSPPAGSAAQRDDCVTARSAATHPGRARSGERVSGPRASRTAGGPPLRAGAF
jgi:hypothetical protein